jgi:hypothetical protein
MFLFAKNYALCPLSTLFLDFRGSLCTCSAFRGGCCADSGRFHSPKVQPFACPLPADSGRLLFIYYFCKIISESRFLTAVHALLSPEIRPYPFSSPSPGMLFLARTRGLDMQWEGSIRNSGPRRACHWNALGSDQRGATLADCGCPRRPRRKHSAVAISVFFVHSLPKFSPPLNNMNRMWSALI